MTLEELEQKVKLLEARIQAQEDIEAIRQLQYRYKNNFQQAKWDEVLACFSDDAVISIKPDGTNVGRGIAEVRRQYSNMAKAHVGAETDFMYHPTISVTGDTAKATWWVTDTMHVIDRPLQSIYGIYTAEYKKINGEWKISYLAHRHRNIKPAPSLGPPPD